MQPLVIYQRQATTSDTLIEELVAHVLKSKAWTENERESLADYLRDSIDEWFDANLKDAK